MHWQCTAYHHMLSATLLRLQDKKEKDSQAKKVLQGPFEESRRNLRKGQDEARKERKMRKQLGLSSVVCSL